MAMVLENALEHDPPLLEPVEARIIALHRHIHRALVVCMPKNHPELPLESPARLALATSYGSARSSTRSTSAP
eukprot:7363944-Prymnesium_polylepis.1